MTESSDAARGRTYADHVREWEAARGAIARARELRVVDHLWLDAAENLLDASAFKDSAALRRQIEIVQQIGREL
jgi:hypothetical protein